MGRLTANEWNAYVDSQYGDSAPANYYMTPNYSMNIDTNSFWDRASNFGKWAIGNKDFSPLGMVFDGLDTILDYKNARDNYKFQKQQHQDNMNLARYNALSDINADLSNANMQLLRWQGFNPERANEYAKSILGSTQDVIKGAGTIGISSDNFANNLAQLNKLANNV